MHKNFSFTSESVTEGHPDKICDQISDAIVDACLSQDPHSRVACETAIKNNIVFLIGEITTNAKLDIDTIVRNTIKDIGYTDPKIGFDYKTCSIITQLTRQSSDISMGVNEGENKEQGAGDQGMMFGYACNETQEFMPMTISLAHALTMKLSEVRKNGTLPWLRPDGKSQVTIRYTDGKPSKIEHIVIAASHEEDVSKEDIEREIREKVINAVIPSEMMDENTKIHINATERFVICGPVGDSGVTGRKIIVDTYGGFGRHGGGCFSGKDPSKVDRSAAYMARYIAKNIVAAELADKCEVKLSYVIGKAEPLSVTIWTFGTGKVPEEKLETLVRKVFPLKPKQIIEHLNLLRPIYKKTAANGHFGRNDPDYTWEKTDMVDTLKKEIESL